MNRPKVIRKVTKMGRDKKPKVARDWRLNITMERVTARDRRVCAYRGCRKHGAISSGVEYAKIIGLGPATRIGRNMVPSTKMYHFECVPPEARPLVRFFRP